MRIAVLLLLCLPLAGCFGVTWPPPPLPDWAMSPHAEPAAPTRARVARRVTSQSAPGQTSSNSKAVPTREGDVLPFSAAWQAREEALDKQLRRTMDICRGC